MLPNVLLRNEVARFILSDLDKAATLMDGKDFQTTRINRDVALLLKSRVALFEATWLKYFKGSAFVPNGEDWPGKTKEYNANYQYPSGNIDNEINWFLEEAMTASKEVAEKYKSSLTKNTGIVKQGSGNNRESLLCDVWPGRFVGCERGFDVATICTRIGKRT